MGDDKVSSEELQKLRAIRKAKREKQKLELKKRKLERLRKQNDSKRKRIELKAQKQAAAIKIQKQWKTFCLRKLLGIGRKHRVDIYIGTKEFKKRNNDELTSHQVIYFSMMKYMILLSAMMEILDGSKKRFDDDDDRPVVEWDLVPSNCAERRRQRKLRQSKAVSLMDKMYDPAH